MRRFSMTVARSPPSQKAITMHSCRAGGGGGRGSLDGRGWGVQRGMEGGADARVAIGGGGGGRGGGVGRSGCRSPGDFCG